MSDPMPDPVARSRANLALITALVSLGVSLRDTVGEMFRRGDGAGVVIGLILVAAVVWFMMNPKK